jgi:Tfp pilus assembly protein PilF
LLKSGGDLKRASDLAKQAVSLSPENVKCRLTLAQVYAAAKLKQSALAELERALALDPKQDFIRDYIRSVKRGEI